MGERPIIQGRISIEEGAHGAVIRGFQVTNNNARDPWGSAMDIQGATDVLVENCELTSMVDDETVVSLRGRCAATVRGNQIRGNGENGVTGVYIDAAATVNAVSNVIENT